MRKTIHLPHLDYTVKVRPLRAPPAALKGAAAYIDMVDGHNSVLYLPAEPDIGLIAHELTHVLQHLCAVRFMDFSREQEHMAYLMQYLMGQVFGCAWGRQKRKVSRK